MVPHGPIRVCFTCDEEIGHGVDHLDLKKLGAHVGYTLDGGGAGEIDGETFGLETSLNRLRNLLMIFDNEDAHVMTILQREMKIG